MKLPTSSAIDVVPQNAFRFSSEFYDPELGLTYYNYRHYSPTDGRFLSRDPIEEEGGLNLYCFIKNIVALAFGYLGKWSDGGIVIFRGNIRLINKNIGSRRLFFFHWRIACVHHP